MDDELKALWAPQVAKVEAGVCLDCDHPLTDPAKSPEGWAWCRNPQCRRPFKITRQFEHSQHFVITMDHEMIQRLYPGKISQPSPDVGIGAGDYGFACQLVSR